VNKKNLIYTLVICLISIACNQEMTNKKSITSHPVYCNPLNLNYRVQHPNSGGKEARWVREGTDPTVGLFKGKYYLFSSVSEGYWGSENLVDWKSLKPSSILNLLSVNRPVRVSSTHSGEPKHVVDEEVMTFWSAATGGSDEWVQVDLGATCLIEAVQANFCEVDLNVTREMARIRGVYNNFSKEGKTPTADDFKTLLPALSLPIPDDPNAVIRYKVLGSLDGKKWTPIIDQSESTRDTPHDFNLAPKPFDARYVRLVNIHTPYKGKFAMRGLRVFGKGYGAKPVAPEFQVDRKSDRRKMEIRWKPVEGADGYVLRYGQEKERLYLANQFYNTNSVLISCLENASEYFVTVDAFNQNGYTKGNSIAKALSKN